MASKKQGKVAKVCHIMKPGWHIKEELPLFLFILVGIMIAMWYFDAGTWEQRFGTGFLIAAILVSVEVIYTMIKCRVK